MWPQRGLGVTLGIARAWRVWWTTARVNRLDSDWRDGSL